MWSPLTRTAAAIAGPKFTIALAELDYDDPFTALISYDGRLSQPWSRVDVRREIVAIDYMPIGQGELFPIALSNEGDVYVLTDDVTRQKIQGTGIKSEDADGRGQTTTLCTSSGTMFVGGEKGQLYQSTEAGWIRITLPDDLTEILALAPDGNGGLIIAGQSQISPDVDFNQIQSAEDIMAMVQSQLNQQKKSPPTGGLWHLNGQEVALIPGSETPHLRAVSQKNGRIIACGVNGCIIEGTLEAVAKAMPVGTTETLISCAQTDNTTWLATDAALYRWDGKTLGSATPIFPATIENGRAAPAYVAGINDTTLYFDRRQEPQLFREDIWQPIPIPKALRARDFDPLARIE